MPNHMLSNYTLFTIDLDPVDRSIECTQYRTRLAEKWANETGGSQTPIR
jgi:hypothetical protein